MPHLNNNLPNPPLGQGSLFIGSNTSYGGCDIKVVVNIYDNGKALVKRSGDLKKELNKAQAAYDATQLEILKNNNTASTAKQGTDQLAIANKKITRGADNLLVLKDTIDSLQSRIASIDSSLPKTSTKVLAEVQTLSISTHREKIAVRSMGHIYPKGFCIAENMNVLIRDRGLVPIKEVNIGDFIYSCPNTYSKITAFYNQGTKDCLKLTTEKGYTLEATPNHPVLTERGWKQAGDIRIGENIFISSKVPCAEVDYPIEDDLLILLAYLIGDGYYSVYEKKSGSKEHRISIIIANTEMATIGREIKDILTKLNIPFRDIQQEGSIQRYISPCINGFAKTDWRLRKYNQLYFLLEKTELSNCGAAKKSIPAFLLSGMSERQIRLFINRLFATDGGYVVKENKEKDKNGFEVVYASTSRKLIEGINILLGKIGFLGSIYTQKKEGMLGGRESIRSNHDCHTIKIKNSIDVYRFIKNIDIFGKELKCRNYFDLLKSKNRDDIVILSRREFRRKIKNIIEAIGLKFEFKKFFNKHNLYNHQLPLTCYKIFSVADDLNIPEVFDYAESLFLERVSLNRNHIFLPLKKKEFIGRRNVYDISVEGTESFVIENIVVHNCRGQREIAGSLIFTVFDENVLYEFLEAHASDFDATTYTSALLDQLPPVDITIAFANELGSISRMTITGVEFIDEGQVMSIEDILTENTVTYVARDVDPMRAVARRKIDENSIMASQFIRGKSASDLLLEDEFLEVKDALSPATRFFNRRNPFI